VAIDLSSKIRDIPDFPKQGIVFKDIMPLLADADALHQTVEELAAFAEPRKPDLILAPSQFVSAEAMLPQLTWVKKWPASHWQLVFQGNVHVLSDEDFAVIENAIKAASKTEVAV